MLRNPESRFGKPRLISVPAKLSSSPIIIAVWVINWKGGEQIFCFLIFDSVPLRISTLQVPSFMLKEVEITVSDF